MLDPKTLITEYLNALSGKPKPPALVHQYVSDERLSEHSAAVEAAFPEYELHVEDMLADGNKVVVRAEFRGKQVGTFAGNRARRQVCLGWTDHHLRH